MTREDVVMLGQYNSEKARGLVHTQEWAEEMAKIQREFDATPPWSTVFKERAK
jgi:hypothetical protein